MTNENPASNLLGPDGSPIGAAAGESELETLRAALAGAEQKASENWDRALRATAELENVRRRVERDAAIQRKYSLESILTDLIPVTDSLELALKAVDSKAPEARAYLEGVELTYKQYWSVLERHGVKVVDPQGEAFNPELHQAVSTQESVELAPNQVATVMQKGYCLHDRLLRPAMVVVTRAPAADAAESQIPS